MFYISVEIFSIMSRFFYGLGEFFQNQGLIFDAGFVIFQVCPNFLSACQILPEASRISIIIFPLYRVYPDFDCLQREFCESSENFLVLAKLFLYRRNSSETGQIFWFAKVFFTFGEIFLNLDQFVPILSWRFGWNFSCFSFIGVISFFFHRRYRRYRFSGNWTISGQILFDFYNVFGIFVIFLIQEWIVWKLVKIL